MTRLWRDEAGWWWLRWPGYREGLGTKSLSIAQAKAMAMGHEPGHLPRPRDTTSKSNYCPPLGDETLAAIKRELDDEKKVK